MGIKKDKLKEAYKKEKPVNIRDILTDKKWEIGDLDYDSKTGKYNFVAIHQDGRIAELSRNRQYVDNLIEELLDAKRKTK